MNSAPFTLQDLAAHARRIDAQGADYADLDDARWLATVRERDAKIARLEKENAALCDLMRFHYHQNPNALERLRSLVSGAQHASDPQIRAAYTAQAAAALRDLRSALRTAVDDVEHLERSLVAR